MPSSKSNSLQKRLKALGTKWAKGITRDANKTAGKPKHIKVKSRSEVQEGKVNVISEATSPKGDAGAYEYGSGVHSRRSKRSKFQMGARGKILIKPKNKKVLAFYWEALSGYEPGTFFGFHGFGGKKLIKISDHPDHKGKGLFRFVEHPGVAAAGGGKGYLAPAINNARKQMRIDVPKEIREEVVGIFRKSFKKG